MGRTPHSHFSSVRKAILPPSIFLANSSPQLDSACWNFRDGTLAYVSLWGEWWHRWQDAACGQFIKCHWTAPWTQDRKGPDFCLPHPHAPYPLRKGCVCHWQSFLFCSSFFFFLSPFNQALKELWGMQAHPRGAGKDWAERKHKSVWHWPLLVVTFSVALIAWALSLCTPCLGRGWQPCCRILCPPSLAGTSDTGALT